MDTTEIQGLGAPRQPAHQTVQNPVRLGQARLGDGSFYVIAGPCSIESEEHLLEVATHIKEHGALGLRGGMFKLRTDPNTFQGLGEKAFEAVMHVKQATGLTFFSEITDPRQIEGFHEFVDVYQVGSRNMYNYALLRELGQVRKPVLLKRGFSATVKEWLLASEYILKGGNNAVILCERGIRTFETSTRNTLDLNSVALVKQTSQLPVIVDPSHGTGVSALVTPLSLAAAALGADGLMVEVHPQPESAKSDGAQALTFDQFSWLMKQLRSVLGACNRELTHL